jgi:predicted 3-demethylubiquinone-9 3-methyltransferase (glyoxalase superfamily)
MPTAIAQKITPFLWFDSNAEEAVRFYTSIFKNSRVVHTTRYPEGAPGPKGSVMTISFELEGQPFTALNGGPHFKFNEAISFVVHCDTQAEIDQYWEKLSAGGGVPVECGWLKDRFGLSWQIVPSILPELMKDPESGDRVMKALLQMVKLDVAKLKEAAGEVSVRG